MRCASKSAREFEDPLARSTTDDPSFLTGTPTRSPSVDPGAGAPAVATKPAQSPLRGHRTVSRWAEVAPGGETRGLQIERAEDRRGQISAGMKKAPTERTP